jgi:hypothetical protein
MDNLSNQLNSLIQGLAELQTYKIKEQNEIFTIF